MKKITGFSQRKHPYQIASYIIFFGDILSYIFIIAPLSDDISKIIGSIFIGISALMIIYFGYKTTNTDPTDEYVVQTANLRSIGKIYDPPEKDYYCSACYSYVQERSKHCRRCDRCVENFDHHCKWVNNCIGRKNYGVFIGMINSVLIFSIVYTILVIILTVKFANQKDLNENSIYLFSHNYDEIIIGMIIIWVYGITTLALLFMDLHLVLLHYWLIKNHITTFEYIIAQKQRKDGQYTIKDQKEKEKKEKNSGSNINDSKHKKTEIKQTCLDFILCLGNNKNSKKRNTNNKSIQINNHQKDPETLGRSFQEKEYKISSQNDNITNNMTTKKDVISLELQESPIPRPINVILTEDINHEDDDKEHTIKRAGPNDRTQIYDSEVQVLKQGSFKNGQNVTKNSILQNEEKPPSQFKTKNPIDIGPKLKMKVDRSKNDDKTTTRTEIQNSYDVEAEERKESSNLPANDNNLRINHLSDQINISSEDNEKWDTKIPDDKTPKSKKRYPSKSQGRLKPISNSDYENRDKNITEISREDIGKISASDLENQKTLRTNKPHHTGSLRSISDLKYKHRKSLSFKKEIIEEKENSQPEIFVSAI